MKFWFNVHEIGSLEGLPVETVARNWNCLCRSWLSSVVFEVAQNNTRLHISTKENGTIFIGRKWSVRRQCRNNSYEWNLYSVYFVYQSQIITKTIIVGRQVVTDINVPLLFSGELILAIVILLCLFSVEEKDRLGIFHEVCFSIRTLCRKYFI
jgi:hypothetical protein